MSLLTWVRFITSVPEFAGKRSKQNRKSIFIDTVSMGLNRSSPESELNTINSMQLPGNQRIPRRLGYVLKTG